MKDYFYRNLYKSDLSVEEYSNKNIGVRMAVHKQKD